MDSVTVTGSTPYNTEVKISSSIMTNQGRLFTYTQTTTAKNVTYSFDVPYSTPGSIPDETNFDTMPTGPYTITVGDMSKTMDVGEQDVLDGGTVTVDIARSVVSSQLYNVSKYAINTPYNQTL